MGHVIQWLEQFFATVPLPLMEVWGRFAYIVGFGLMVAAFSGLTFQPGGQWGLGMQRQAWDAKALLSMILTFALVLGTGYAGSFIVLVPGAQTFESLKDLSVFLCVVLLGYPALLIVPFAYGLSDLAEGVPPSYLLDWLPGYFINPACFWVAAQVIGKQPDFRLGRTWLRYLAFVLIFMCIEPVLWGYICSPQFTPEISFRNITPALFFTTGITWLIAPPVMLAALPLARRLRLFWAEIPGHVKERVIGQTFWCWESGKGFTHDDATASRPGVPIRMAIVMPFVAMVLLMVALSGYFVLRSAETDANKLAGRLHEEIAQNILLKLDGVLTQVSMNRAHGAAVIDEMLQHLPIARDGRAFVVDAQWRLLGSSLMSRPSIVQASARPGPAAHLASAMEAGDDVVRHAIMALKPHLDGKGRLATSVQYRFDLITAKPLMRETWLAQATPYRDAADPHLGWTVVTVMPSAYYLEGVREGNSQAAAVSAWALALALSIARCSSRT
jgi:two-component system sensor histidine kinase/response regulator